MNNLYKPEGMLISTSQNREFVAFGRMGLERAAERGAIVEATVLLCDSEMNLHVDICGVKAIIPREEVCYCPGGEEVKDIAIITRVGKPVCFKVISVEDRGGRAYAILSRRAAQIECMNNYLADLIPGDIIPSRVTHLENFGAFVDIGCGIVGLLSVDCISISRFSHPKDRLRNGMYIYTVLKSVDEENKRFFVSLRELLGTWEENAAHFKPGQTVAGIIRSVESYGVFVELMPNLAGLAELKEGFVPHSDVNGKYAAVYIKSIIPERMKIKLVLVDSYAEEAKCQKIDYFVDCKSVSHIDGWKYSPDACERYIGTVFI